VSNGIKVAIASRQAHYAANVGTPVCIRIPEVAHPLYLRAGTSDLAIFDQVIVGRELEGVRHFNPSVLVDAGANIGVAAALFATWWPEALVICIEVESGNLSQLKLNTAGYPNIKIVPAGLWSHSTKLAIQNGDADACAFIVTEQPDGPIAAIGVWDLMTQEGLSRIDLLKMDIEGSEIEVFSSAGAWIDLVDVVCVELHERLRSGCIAAFHGALSNQPFSIGESGEYSIAVRHGAS
jgi:FkbM family methyltransferase